MHAVEGHEVYSLWWYLHGTLLTNCVPVAPVAPVSTVPTVPTLPTVCTGCALLTTHQKSSTAP